MRGGAAFGSRPLRLLISARDPGAAQTLVPVIRAALRRDGIAPVPVAQGAARALFAQAGITARGIDAPACPPDDPAAGAILDGARRLLAEVRPDAVLTGLSGPGVGIDEALIQTAGACPCYSVQDVDGFLVSGFGRPAGTYFVANEWAARATLENAAARGSAVRTVVVGSLKHAHYGGLDPLALRGAGRALLESAGRALLESAGRALPESAGGGPGSADVAPRFAVFYGQPAWGWSGYARSLERIAGALAARRPAVAAFYRPHPKETPAERRATLDRFAAACVPVAGDPNAAVETSLAAADLVLTCFSTCGIDHVYLHAGARAPLGGVLFVMTEPDLRAAYAADTGAPLPWPALQGLAMAVTEPEALGAALDTVLSEGHRREMWERARGAGLSATAAPEAVLATIFDDLGHPAARPDQIP